MVIRRNLHRCNNPFFAKSGWRTRCQLLSMLNLKTKFELIKMIIINDIQIETGEVASLKTNNFICLKTNNFIVSQNSTCNLYNRKLSKVPRILTKEIP